MAQGDPRTMTGAQTEAASIDAGLRNHMLRVYNYMALGVAFTGAVALAVLSNQALFQIAQSLMLLWFIAVIGMGFVAPKIMMTKSTTAAQVCFWVHAALWGLLLAPVLSHYLAINPWIVPKAFFITTGAFAGTSLIGYTTKKDLSGMAAFMMMAMVGLLIAIVVNLFIGSTLMSLLISCGVVLVMAGMTAYETQEIKNMYSSGDSGNVAASKAIFGAFQLYTSFVVMFIHILNILGIMNE